MSAPLSTQKRANTISAALFVAGIVLLYFTGYVIQGVPALLGTVLFVRQGLRGRYYDMALTFVVFTGAFLTYDIEYDIAFAIPVAFTMGGFFLILREFIDTRERFGLDEIENLAQEIEEEQNDEFSGQQ